MEEAEDKKWTVIMSTSLIVQNLWNYCNVLRDDGMSYGDWPVLLMNASAASADPLLRHAFVRRACRSAIRRSARVRLRASPLHAPVSRRGLALSLRTAMSNADSIEQLTYLLFLKMVDERTKPAYNQPSQIPDKYSWPSLPKKDGNDLVTAVGTNLTRADRLLQSILGKTFLVGLLIKER
jgi:hypothetical protein